MTNKPANKITKIKMKDGRVLEIPYEKGEKVQQALGNLDEHCFIRLTSIDKTINTTEIDTVENTIDRHYERPEQDPDYELTQEDKKRRSENLQRLRKELEGDGVIKKVPA